MAAFVQGTFNDQAASSATTAATFASSQTATNTNIVVAGQFSGTTTTTLSSLADTAGNTYIPLQTGLINGTQGPAYLYWVPQIKANASNTVTATWSAAVTNSELIILEYNLGLALIALSANATASSVTSFPIGPITLAVLGLTATWERGVNATITPPAGYVQRTASAFGLYYDNLATAPGPITVTWGTTTSSSPLGFLMGVQTLGSNPSMWGGGFV